VIRRHARKVVLIGLDAAELSLIQQHRAELPHLGACFERGPVHKLRTTAGLLPGSVWPTFYTGKLPGHHGIYHHLQWDPQRMGLRRVSADWLDCEPFWTGLECAGLDVCVLDVPMTLGARLRRGIEVANWGSHDQLAHFGADPVDVGRALRRRFGKHPMGAEIPVTKTPRELERIRRKLVAGAQRKGELARWLYALRDWDLFVCIFGETHRGGHILWPEEERGESSVDALLDVYRAVDEAVGTLLAAVRDDTVVVLFALHGMGPNRSQEHFVPLAMDRANQRFRGAAGGASEPGPEQRSLVRTLRGRVPAALQNAIAHAVPVPVRDWVVDRQISAGHDWSTTRGFATLADLNGYLRFNLAGRERCGTLAPSGAEFEAYRAWLVTAFESLRDRESGSALVQRVVFDDPELEGRRRALLPDGILTWRPARPAARVGSDLLGAMDARIATGRGGNHRFEGFCVIASPDWAAAVRPPEHIADLARLTADLLGCASA